MSRKAIVANWSERRADLARLVCEGVWSLNRQGQWFVIESLRASARVLFGLSLPIALVSYSQIDIEDVFSSAPP